ncbi:MAG: Clp protease N-terminal domain-containing protein [Flavobacterium sp.]
MRYTFNKQKQEARISFFAFFNGYLYVDYKDQIAQIIKRSRAVAIEVGDSYVSSHHFIIAMADFENSATAIFNGNKIDFLSLKKALQKSELTQIPEKFHLTKEFERVLKIADYYAWLRHSGIVSAKHYVLAMRADKGSLAGDYLRQCNLNYSNFKNDLKLKTRGKPFEMVAQSNFLIRIGFIKAVSQLISK